MSGTKKDRPELIRLKDKVRPGDSIVVESFSRLGRSTKDLIELVEISILGGHCAVSPY